MSDTVNRFIENTLSAFTGEYSASQTIHRLEKEIYILHAWLVENRLEDFPDLWRQKRETMLRKIANLEEIKQQNQIQ